MLESHSWAMTIDNLQQLALTHENSIKIFSRLFEELKKKRQGWGVGWFGHETRLMMATVANLGSRIKVLKQVISLIKEKTNINICSEKKKLIFFE